MAQEIPILYWSPHTRASRPRWLLEELGIEYQIKEISWELLERGGADIHSLHPLGRVPVLEIGSTRMFESVAICMYLADRYSAGTFAPLTGDSNRAPYLQWIAFALTQLEAPLNLASLHTRELPEGERVDEIVPRAVEEFAQAAKVLDKTIGDSHFIIGDKFTVTDLLITSLLGWAGRRKLLEDFRKLEVYRDRHLAREAAKRVFADDSPG